VCDNRNFLQSYDNPRVSIGRKAAQNQRLFEKPWKNKNPSSLRISDAYPVELEQQVQDIETSF
jgi:hypothetical protein